MNKVLFDSFNARYLTFEEIVESFVPNKQYEDLKLNNHSLLMGPRGSGKTTLLKMLSPICQFLYDNEEGLSIPFWGIYVPTDIQWKRQIEYFEENPSIPYNVKDLISKAVIRCNIQIALIKTYYSLLDIKGLLSEEDAIDQFNFSKSLIEAWDLPKSTLPDLESIEFCVRNRLTSINVLISRLDKKNNVVEAHNLDNFFYQDYLDLVKVACFSFKRVYKNKRQFTSDNFRWALCFDELEIAPSWLQEDLLDRLRSSEQDIIFKLTTSPIVSTKGKIDEKLRGSLARQEEDYKIIRTWICNDYDNKSWTSFCRKLVQQKLRKRNITDSPEHLFGNDLLERNLINTFAKPENDKLIKSYAKGSLNWRVFKELAIVDKTFFRYLENKDIKPFNPVPKDQAEVDSVFRKIKPLVIFRYQIKGLTRLRSRKNISLYYGVPFIYELSDGNPRALMAILDVFLSNIKYRKNGELLSYSISFQSKVVTQFSDNYLKLITSHPDANKVFKKGSYSNLGDLLLIIGNYFYNLMIVDPFTADPYGSFVVDNKVAPHIVDMIELGVQLGAIIYVNPEKAISFGGIVGKKFRLCYLLHPTFKLPKREYAHVNLSKITNRENSDLIKEQLLFDLK